MQCKSLRDSDSVIQSFDLKYLKDREFERKKLEPKKRLSELEK